MYDRERRSGPCEVSSMSTVVRALATMPVAARNDEIGPLRPDDGRSVERRALLVDCSQPAGEKG